MKIIGFGYEHKVGKDQTVKFAMSYIRMEYPKIKCERVSIGDYLRDLAYQLYGWAGMEDCVYYHNHPEAKEEVLATIGKSPRQVCVELGEAIHKISERTLIELVLKDTDADVVFMPDVYRPIEVEYIHQFKGLYIRLIRPGHDYKTVGKLDAIQPDETWYNKEGLKELNKITKEAIDRWVKKGII